MTVRIADEWLTAEITAVSQAKAYLDELLRLGCCYHPDERAENIVDPVGGAMFDRRDWKLLDMRCRELHNPEFDWGQHECPAGYILHKLGM